MSNIKWNENVLTLGDEEIVFDDSIENVTEWGGLIIVITDPRVKNYENLYGVSIATGKYWRIQSISEIKSEPYFSVYIRVREEKGKLIAIDFLGRQYIINALNGKIEGQLETLRW